MTDVLDEWLTTTSALAWILTRDASFAASMRGPISANRFSVEVAMWMATRMADTLPSVRGPAAREALMDACRRGKLAVMGFGGRLDGAFNGEAEVIPSNAFAYLRLDEAAKPTLEPVDLHGRAWHSLAFDRADLLRCFPPVTVQADPDASPRAVEIEVDCFQVGQKLGQHGEPEDQPEKLTLPMFNLYTALVTECGPLPGQFVVVTGIPNHGKSRWLDQVAVSMSQLHGWRWAMFSPETGSEQHIADLCEIKAGLPFHDGPNERMDQEDLHTALAWVRERVAFIDAGEHTPSVDWVLERARAAVLRHGINALIIDPYNELEAGRSPHQTETEFVSQLISKCKRFAKVHEVTVFMVAHPTSTNGRRG